MTSGNNIVDSGDEYLRRCSSGCPNCGSEYTEAQYACGSNGGPCIGYKCEDYFIDMPWWKRVWLKVFKRPVVFADCIEVKREEVCGDCGRMVDE